MIEDALAAAMAALTIAAAGEPIPVTCVNRLGDEVSYVIDAPRETVRMEGVPLRATFTGQTIYFSFKGDSGTKWNHVLDRSTGILTVTAEGSNKAGSPPFRCERSVPDKF